MSSETIVPIIWKKFLSPSRLKRKLKQGSRVKKFLAPSLVLRKLKQESRVKKCLIYPGNRVRRLIERIVQKKDSFVYVEASVGKDHQENSASL